MAAPVRYAFTTDDWRRMGEAGLFGEDDRVELLDGEVVAMSPIGSGQAACVKRLARLLSRSVGDRAILSVQDPVRLDRHSEPQPDLALLRPRPDFYAAAHPGSADILLLVEVAETSLSFDRDQKAGLYARSGVPVTWVVDLAGQEVLVLSRPGPNGYLAEERALRDGRLSLAGLGDLGDVADLAVDDVLGAA